MKTSQIIFTELEIFLIVGFRNFLNNNAPLKKSKYNFIIRTPLFFSHFYGVELR